MTPRASPSTGRQLPSRIGRYEVVCKLGAGGMASVFLARATGPAGFERLVAIKRCHPSLREINDFAHMFLDEARITARIHHPNVVPVLDVSDEESEDLFLVMEYVEGASLTDLSVRARETGTAISMAIAHRIVLDVLAGLHAAHELTDRQGDPLNVVHRDVSPSNILVGTDGCVRLSDFGIARAEARLVVTRDAQLKGKIDYMAPEQILLQPITRRSDIFATGIVAWELLTGSRLFPGRSVAEVANLLLTAPIPPASTVREDIPSAVDEVLATALEREAERRFASAAEFSAALHAAAGTEIATQGEVSHLVYDLNGEVIERRRQSIGLEPTVLIETPAPADPSDRGPDSLVTTPASPARQLQPVPPAATSRGRRGLVIASLLVLVVAGSAAVVTQVAGGSAEQLPSAAGSAADATPAGSAPVVVPGETTISPSVALPPPVPAADGAGRDIEPAAAPPEDPPARSASPPPRRQKARKRPTREPAPPQPPPSTFQPQSI